MEEYDDISAEWNISFHDRLTLSLSLIKRRLNPASILNMGLAVNTFATPLV